MSVYTDQDISKLINKKNIVIHPYHPESLTGVGYDLHIGCIRPLSKIDKFIEDNNEIKIPPGCHCLIITEEFVWISHKLIGTLHARGTLAAKGLYTNATNVDPNFKGQMIMSVYNISENDIVIPKTDNKSPTFITLIIHEVKTKTKMLFGEENTKSSTRVISQLKNDTYKDETLYQKQIKNLNDLQSYMQDCNVQYEPRFENTIRNVNKLISPQREEAIDNFRKKMTFRNIISLVCSIMLICLLIVLCLEVFIGKKVDDKTFDNLKTALIVLAAGVTLYDRNFKKKE